MRIIEWLNYQENWLNEVITNSNISVDGIPTTISIDNRDDIYPEIPEDKKDVGIA